MNGLEYLIVVIIVMALSTYFTRLIPFLIFSPGRESSLLNYVAKSTPPNGNDDSCYLYVEGYELLFL